MGTDGVDFTNREEITSKSSENGTVTLKWSDFEGEVFTLQQSDSEAFEKPVIRYSGKDASSVISGLAEGTHFFRVGQNGKGNWSAPLEVTVKFFPRDKLVLLLVLGAVVVLCTMGAIVGGWIKTKREGEEV